MLSWVQALGEVVAENDVGFSHGVVRGGTGGCAAVSEIQDALGEGLEGCGLFGYLVSVLVWADAELWNF